MQLERCKDQPSTTLDDYYQGIAQHSRQLDTEIGKAMLDLLVALRARPDDRRVWGLTSHYRLCLLAQDTYLSPWFVIVAALDNRNYTIEYLMPSDVEPWPNAYVRGEARSTEAAANMVAIAMSRCDGWKAR